MTDKQILRFLVDLDRRSFVAYFRALSSAAITMPQQPEEDEAPEPDDAPMLARFAREYRTLGFRPPRPKKDQPAPEWQRHLLTDETGKLIKGTANAQIALREDPALSGILGFDPKARRMILKGRLPDDWEPEFRMRVLTETDVSGLYEYLLRQGLRLTRAELVTAVKRIARENPLGASPL